MKPKWRLVGLSIGAAAALLWAVPFLWMAVASLRPGVPADIASLTPSGPFGLSNFSEAWRSGSFPLWYLNTALVVGGILAVQLVTITAAGYAFARLSFPGRELLFAMFLLQLLLIPALLIVPNLGTLVSLHLYDTLPGIMAPYFASAFGTFLMRQTFRAIPRDYEEAAMLEGASIPALIRHVLVPLARPGLIAFAIVSVTSHWNEFLWPLMAVSSPRHQVLTVGLASFASGAEAGSAWGIVAAGTFLVAGPLLVLFLLFQRRFVSSFPETGALVISPRSYTADEANLLKDCAGVTAGTAFTANSFARTVQAAVDSIKQKAYAAAGTDAAQQRVMEDLDRRGRVAWRDTLLDTQPPYGPYAARLLYGIWAAAPYLHNGSVPTLYDLLLPPEQRPKTFALGEREYDPVRIGFAAGTACTRLDCGVDTTRTGDGNGGHLWGTDLSEPDRMAFSNTSRPTDASRQAPQTWAATGTVSEKCRRIPGLRPAARLHQQRVVRSRIKMLRLREFRRPR